MSNKKEKAPEAMSRGTMEKFDDFDCRPEPHAAKALIHVPEHVLRKIKKVGDDSR